MLPFSWKVPRRRRWKCGPIRLLNAKVALNPVDALLICPSVSANYIIGVAAYLEESFQARNKGIAFLARTSPRRGRHRRSGGHIHSGLGWRMS
jgi:hypothetical protein